MKKLKKILFILCTILFSILIPFNTIAQPLNKPLDLNLGSFVFPLEIGNLWNYRNGYFQPDMKLSIIDTTRIEGRKYYLKKYQTPSGYFDAFQYLRLREDGYYVSRVLDSNLTFFPNEDYLYFKKNANIGDVWHQEDRLGIIWYHIVLDTIQISSFWGSFLPVKIVEITDSSLTRYWEYWSEEFGLVQQQNADIGSGGWSLLWGCYINGQQYGDTVLVSVDDENPNLPSNFKLHQNYPNPFNPTTQISYSIKEDGFVRLKVYDLLGSEVAILVSETKESGYHSVEFNASELPSGVYIYTLQAGDFISSKKMILMK